MRGAGREGGGGTWRVCGWPLPLVRMKAVHEAPTTGRLRNARLEWRRVRLGLGRGVTDKVGNDWFKVEKASGSDSESPAHQFLLCSTDFIAVGYLLPIGYYLLDIIDYLGGCGRMKTKVRGNF